MLPDQGYKDRRVSPAITSQPRACCCPFSRLVGLLFACPPEIDAFATDRIGPVLRAIICLRLQPWLLGRPTQQAGKCAQQARSSNVFGNRETYHGLPVTIISLRERIWLQ
jgi:hypothetical protein